MKSFPLLSLILFLSFLVWGQSVTELPDVYNPYQIEVSKDILFIADSQDSKIKVYKISDGIKLQCEIGKEGQGPGEFPWEPRYKIMHDMIFVSSRHKIFHFDFSGKLLMEKNIHNGYGVTLPVKESYFAQKLERAEQGLQVGFYLLDREGKSLKKIYSGRGMFRKDRKQNLFDINFLDTRDDLILFAHMDGSGVEICDSSGKTLRKIATDYPFLPFTAEDRDSVYKYWDETPPYKENKDNWRRITVFPDRFPTILTCRLDGETLYVITYQRKNGKFLSHIYNLAGKELGETWLPIRYTAPVSHMITPFTISGGRLYQLVEDETSGNWCVLSSRIEY